MSLGQTGWKNRIAVFQVGENDFLNGKVAVGLKDDLGRLRLVPGGL